MNKDDPIPFAVRYGFFLVVILCLLRFAVSTENFSAERQTRQTGESVQPSRIFLPTVARSDQTRMQVAASLKSAALYEAPAKAASTTSDETRCRQTPRPFRILCKFP